jgi:hypothetical protein
VCAGFARHVAVGLASGCGAGWRRVRCPAFRRSWVLRGEGTAWVVAEFLIGRATVRRFYEDSLCSVQGLAEYEKNADGIERA